MTKPQRKLFVIMPFVAAGRRDETQLAAFFKIIKQALEAADLRYAYTVYRSADAFDITTEILRDLCRADIVLADVSVIADTPNPNVMYELGVRLAVSESPVILIRENTAASRPFDLFGYHTYDYDAYDYPALTEKLIGKLSRLESGEDQYDNPVIRVIREEMALHEPDLSALPPERQRDLVFRGVRIVAEAVTRAMGPHGLGYASGSVEDVTVYLRGTDIAGQMHSTNPFENRGVVVARQAAADVALRAGDGTKLVLTFGGSLTGAGARAMAAGILPRDLATDFQEALELTKRTLREFANELDVAPRAVVRSACVGAAPDLGVEDVLERVGEHGLVSVESLGPGDLSGVEVVDGMVFDRGALDESMLDRCGGVSCTMTDCLVLVSHEPVRSHHELLPAMEIAAGRKAPLLLIAEDVAPDALGMIAANNERQSLQCVAIRAPSHRERRMQLLEDIAIFTGGRLITQSRGSSIAGVQPDDLGSAQTVVVSRNHTAIQGGRGKTESIRARVRLLEMQIADSSDGYDRERLLQRLAWLAGSTAVIRVGGATRQAVDVNRYRVSSALQSVSAAIDGGIVPGGGLALFRAAEDVRRAAGEDPSPGLLAFAEALEAPLRAIVANSGQTADVVSAITASESKFMGFDAETGEVRDLVGAGVVDARLVIQTAIEVGAEMAATLLSAGAWSPVRPQ